MKAMLVLLWFTPFSGPHASRDRYVTTQANAVLLSTTVKPFAAACGRLPTEAEGLGVLLSKPADWRQDVPWSPFLETTDLPNDGWGNPFVYVVDPNLDGGFGIYSRGRDGKTASNGNDRDDINTWSDTSRRDHYQGLAHQAARISRVRLLLLGLLLIGGIGIAFWVLARSSRRSRHPDGTEP